MARHGIELFVICLYHSVQPHKVDFLQMWAQDVGYIKMQSVVLVILGH